MIQPTVSQIQLDIDQIFSSSSGLSSHGCGLSQSSAAILERKSRSRQKAIKILQELDKFFVSFHQILLIFFTWKAVGAPQSLQDKWLPYAATHSAIAVT